MITNKHCPKDTNETQSSMQPCMEPQVINTYRMSHTDQPNRYLGGIDARVVIVSLSHFNKSEDQLESLEDKWLYAFKDESQVFDKRRIYAYKHINNVDKTQSDEDNGLQTFYRMLTREMVSLNHDIYRYEKNIVELRNFMHDLQAKSREIGRMEVYAQRMLAKNVSDDEILAITEFTTQELAELKESLMG